MGELLRGWVLRLFRVPPEPELPPGRVLRVFNAAPAYLRYRTLVWALVEVAVALLPGTGLLALVLSLSTRLDGAYSAIGKVAAALIAIFFVAQIVVSYLVLRLDFDMRWYVLMDRSLRIREGILTVREKTMTFANIQQITIDRNPLQRMFGLADVHVRTAGGGAGDRHTGAVEGMHEAYFRGVDNPEEIRQAILEQVRRHRDDGTAGGPAGAVASRPMDGAAAPAIDAARELLGEIRGLRDDFPAPRRAPT